MLVVNLYGSPSSGKSTNASRLFAMLKDKNINCEIITEYAKSCVWEERFFTLKDQLYITANQYHKMFVLEDKVDVLITDSPLLLGMIYNKSGLATYEPLVIELHKRFDSLNVFLNRVKPYHKDGRMQTEWEANVLAMEIKGMLNKHVSYIEVDGNAEGCEKIIEDIERRLSWKK